MRAFLIFLLSVSAVFALENFSVNVDGFASPVGVWAPKAPKNSPIVVWFHGGMTSSKCGKGLEAGEGFSKFAPTAVVASPSACGGHIWPSEFGVKVTDALLDSLEKRLGQKIAEVNLVGVSDGALGVVYYSLFGRRTVKNRLLVSSFLEPFGKPTQLAREPKLGRGTWTFLQGGSDRLYPAERTYPWLSEFCKAEGLKCTLHFDAAGEHDWSYWAEKRTDWLLDFARLL